MNLRQRDKKHFGRQGEPEDVIVGNSADSYLTDTRGRKYIDFMMGWCVGNLGWGNTEIRAAAQKFDGPDYVHPDYLYRPWAQLAEMLPVSTTHVSCGALFGIGAVTRQGHWGIILKIVSAWLTTLPTGAVLGALSFWVVSAA
jgi:hypothetical protein